MQVETARLLQDCEFQGRNGRTDLAVRTQEGEGGVAEEEGGGGAEQLEHVESIGYNLQSETVKNRRCSQTAATVGIEKQQLLHAAELTATSAVHTCNAHTGGCVAIAICCAIATKSAAEGRCSKCKCYRF